MTTLPYVIVDTNVVFEGLTRQGGASGFIIEAWLSGLFQAYITDALAYEYVAVLSEHLSPQRWQAIQPVLSVLLARAEFVTVYYRWRPTSPDPADEHIIDCAMNAGAIVVTHNVKDFRTARKGLGLHVMTPVEFVRYLAE